MNWFRIELCTDGSVHTCVPVSGKKNGIRSVFFVAAETPELAIEKLMARRERRLETKRRRDTRHRAEREAHGLCENCAKPSAPYRRCLDCRKKKCAQRAACKHPPKKDPIEVELRVIANNKIGPGRLTGSAYYKARFVSVLDEILLAIDCDVSMARELILTRRAEFDSAAVAAE